MLHSIRSPEDIRGLSYEECAVLAGEIREEILRTVSKNGGHLASNLGVVETVLAVHRMFDTPRDTLLFDVGHQCYAHKLLTGRQDGFSSIRQFGGLSGFTFREESPYDTVTAGHSGASLSVALGMAEADRLAGRDCYTVCVIGDGAFTNGMIFEALNNCVGRRGLRLIILLNDNEMSISRNVGGLSAYLTRVRTSRRYHAFKRRLEKMLRRIPLLGNSLAVLARRIKDSLKRLTRQETVFENLGISYIGTVDGNDQAHLEEVLSEAKAKDVPCLVHVITRKGCGYPPAEKEASRYHAVAPFDRETGAVPATSDTFSAVFGRTLCRLAEEDESITAITAAMCDGTGLAPFAAAYPERLFDVGIAEEHAVAFGGGLSLRGKKPVVALYSTFSQRVYDQLFHDIALQKTPLVLALDRAGLVPGDGLSHQGIYDAALFSSIPGISIWSPDTFEDLEKTLAAAVNTSALTVIRYPRGKEMPAERSVLRRGETLSFTETPQPHITIFTYGRLTARVLEAASSLRGKCRIRVVRLDRIYPLDPREILPLTADSPAVLFAEEGILSGGIGEKLAALLSENGYSGTVRIRAIRDRFVPGGDLASLETLLGFTPAALADWILESHTQKSEDTNRD